MNWLWVIIGAITGALLLQRSGAMASRLSAIGAPNRHSKNACVSWSGNSPG